MNTKTSLRNINLTSLLSEYAIFVVLVVVVLFFSLFSPYFLSLTNLIHILLQQSYVIIAAIGLSFVIISGGIDLSVGWQMSFIGVTVGALARWYGVDPLIAIFIGLILGLVCGLFNGLLSISLNVHPLIVTLGTTTVFQGLSYIVSKQSVILNLPRELKFFGQSYIAGIIPVSSVLMVICIAVGSFLLNKTYWGRYLYAIGSNEEAARLSGIDVKRMKVSAFALCGIFVAVASLILFGRAGSAASITGPGTEFLAITGAFLGGVSFKGGEGKVWGVVTGVFILGVLSNGMQLIGMGTYFQYIIRGFVLLAAVGFDEFQKITRGRMKISA